MDRNTFARTLIVAALAALLVVVVGLLHRGEVETPSDLHLPSAQSLGDLSAGLQRCNELSPEDAEQAGCSAIWKKNRDRFFGHGSHHETVAPAPSTAGPSSADTPAPVRTPAIPPAATGVPEP